MFAASRDNYRLSCSVLTQLTLGFVCPRCGKAATEGDLSAGVNCWLAVLVATKTARDFFQNGVF